ncbi:HNH endonuclease signature motif containing protein (plasmid) [Streptomyces sp. GDS52]|uniref:HNH endonuclease signature motif containing protein n=1 Tax=Streptomyces sp. GDS52 TaxID=3406419 RepID=UPI003FD0FCFE
MPKKNLTGQRFGQLVVLGEGQRRASGVIMWLCRCDCGTEVAVQRTNLTSKRSTSCGCSRKIRAAGETFGLLTVVKEVGHVASGGVAWLCRCQCGTEVVRAVTDLRSGRAKSCGCAWLTRTHGQTGTPLYSRWNGIIQRTTNPNDSHYKWYGGRGISVCHRWRESFEAFAADMGPTFSPDLEIDRIDPNGNYEPSNCRWATRSEQARNTRRNKRLTFRGQTMVLTDWANLLGIKPATLSRRVSQLGWSVERALTTGASPEALARVVETPTND